MPQSEAPGTPGTPTRNTVVTGATTTRHNRGVCNSPVVAAGGGRLLWVDTKGGSVTGGLAAMGGLHAPAIGVSTKPMRSALLDWFEQERKRCAGQADVAW